MSDTDYEYRGLMAETWDLLRGDTSGWSDRGFYLEFIQKSENQPVLDVGCGTGRLLLDYLGEGIDIDGLDNSPEMLEICHQKSTALGLNPNLYEGWMETLDLPRKYRTIIVPSLTIQLLPDLSDIAQAMERFFAHLEPGGALIIPFMVFKSPDTPSSQSDWKMIAEKERPEDGALLRHWIRAFYDVPNKLQHTEDRYEILVDGEVVKSEDHQRSPAVRWYSQDEARALFEKAGFRDIRITKEASLESAALEDTVFNLVGRKR